MFASSVLTTKYPPLWLAASIHREHKKKNGHRIELSIQSPVEARSDAMARMMAAAVLQLVVERKLALGLIVVVPAGGGRVPMLASCIIGKLHASLLVVRAIIMSLAYCACTNKDHITYSYVILRASPRDSLKEVGYVKIYKLH